MARHDELPFDLMIAKTRPTGVWIENILDDVGHAAEAVGEGLADAAEAMGEGDDDGTVAMVIDGVVSTDLRPGVSLNELVRIREERGARKG